MIVVIAFLYNAFGIPLRSSYPYQTESNLIYWLIADYIADAIYFIDMLLVKPRIRFMRGGLPVVSNLFNKYFEWRKMFTNNLFFIILKLIKKERKQINNKLKRIVQVKYV